MTNAFLAVAEIQQNAHSKARDRAKERQLTKLVVSNERDAPMVAKPSDKAAWEASQLLKRYNASLRQRRTELVNGPHGLWVQELLAVLANLEQSTPAALVKFVERAAWLKKADKGTRLDVLSIISAEIASHRVRQGLAPFDDSLPFSDEAPTAFELIRRALTGVGVAA